MRRIFIALVLVLAGCPKSAKQTRTLPDVPTNGDPQAHARFQQARASFERDAANNVDEFEAIAREYPDDPIAPFAAFYAGRAAFRAGSYEDARADLDPLLARDDLDEALRRRVRLYAGMIYGYLGDHARAIATLDDPDGVADDAERAERAAVLAEAYAATGRPGPAFSHYDSWFPLASKAERAFILARVGEVAAGLATDAARAEYDALAAKRTPSGVALAERLAALATASGDRDLATAMRAAASSARAELGLDASALDRGAGNTNLLGAVLPMSGKRSRVGEAAMAGLGLAAGTFDSKPARGVGVDGAPKPFVLSTRDSKSLADAAADAVSQLVAEGAVAVVGPLDAASVRVAARQAARDGIPLVSLDALGGADIGVDSPFVFHVTLSPEARARALARYAVGKGVKRFAILRPETNYGRETAEAFEAEVVELGGTVIASATYSTKQTSFGDVIGKIRGKPWDAVFVPDVASRLELVAPALATANLLVKPIGAKDPKKGRAIALLSTAEALRPKYLRGSGRYSEGAVLAPGFYADSDDPIIGPYVTRFEAAFGRAPTYLDAYAYDAALAVRAAVEAGARSRAEVSAAMATSTVDGLTGAIRFSAARHRADSGLLYVVTKDSGGDYRIRAQR